MAELVDGAGGLTEVAEIVRDGSCCWASVEVCLRSPEREARERSSLVCGSLVLPSQRRVQLGLRSYWCSDSGASQRERKEGKPWSDAWRRRLGVYIEGGRET